MDEWYYLANEQQQGPVTRTALQGMISSGQVPADTLVWHHPMPDWLPANTVPKLAMQGVPTQQEPVPDALPVTASVRHITRTEPAFLRVSVVRLLIMSLVSCGIFELYWMYRNWRYLKERDGINIKPFWRGWFGIFFCHSLFKSIAEDPELTDVETPTFPAGSLATIWVILVVIANALGNIKDNRTLNLIGFAIPSYLCFVPVQLYINRANRKLAHSVGHSRWTFGQLLCLFLGILAWLGATTT